MGHSDDIGETRMLHVFVIEGLHVQVLFLHVHVSVAGNKSNFSLQFDRVYTCIYVAMYNCRCVSVSYYNANRTSTCTAHVHVTYQEGDLRGEDQLVPLKQAPGCVHKHHVHVGDAVNQIRYTLLQIIRLLCLVDCIVEHNAEGLEGELVQRVDLDEIIKDEVQQGGPGSSRTVVFSGFIDLLFGDVSFLYLLLDLTCCALCGLQVLHQCCVP